MKKLVSLVAWTFVGLALLNGYARADRVDMMNGNVMLYCQNAADIFKQGVWARTVGIARKVEQAPADMAAPKSEAEMPRDSMYHEQWNAMTEQERAFFSEHLFVGYDEADRIIGKFVAGAGKLPENQGFTVQAVISPEVGSRMAQAYLENCLRVRSAGRRVSLSNDELARQIGADLAGLHELVEQLAASSEHLRTGSANMVCGMKRDMARWVMSKVTSGMTKADFWSEHPLPENWSVPMKEWAAAMVDEAYRWPRGAEDFAEYILRNCLEGK